MPKDIANDREGNTYGGQPPLVQEPEPAPAAAQLSEHPAPAAMPSPPQAPAMPQMPAPPQMTAAGRVRVAARRRDETDYIFNYWTALGWTILTLGIYGFTSSTSSCAGCGTIMRAGSSSSTRQPPWRGNRPGGRAFSRK